MTTLFQHYNYAVVIVLMMIGLYVVFSSSNMIKKLVGLSVFQTSVFLLYISIGKITGGKPPILDPKEYEGHGGGHESAPAAAHGTGHEATSTTHEAVETGHEAMQDATHAAADTAEVIYSNPLPHVLILTAIVVGVATLAIGLALVVRTREAYGTIEENEIDELDYCDNLEGHVG